MALEANFWPANFGAKAIMCGQKMLLEVEEEVRVKSEAISRSTRGEHAMISWYGSRGSFGRLPMHDDSGTFLTQLLKHQPPLLHLYMLKSQASAY
jgi:hypothetical protein